MPGKGTVFNYARSIDDDAEGNLWIVSCEWQLLRLGKSGFEIMSTNWNLAGIPAALAHDRLGRIWIETDHELATESNGKFDTAWNESNQGNFNVDLGESRDGGVWVAANGRLRRFNAGTLGVGFGSFCMD